MDPQASGESGYPVPPQPPVYGGPPPPASFSFSNVFGQTFSVYGANFAAFLTITALVSIPTILAALIVGTSRYAALIPVLLGFVTGPISSGAITYGVYQYLRGRQTTVGECLRVGFANVLPVLGLVGGSSPRWSGRRRTLSSMVRSWVLWSGAYTPPRLL